MGWINDTVAAVWSLGQQVSYGGPQRAGDVEIPGDDNDYWYEPATKKGASGIRVTADIALKSSALFACVKFLAETMASLPFAVYRKLPDGGISPAPEHPLDELIRYQSNKIQTAVEFWETVILHAALRGTGYAEIVPGPRGAVDQLISLHTDRVVPEWVNDGTRVGFLRFKVTNPHTNQTRTLLQEEVFRIPGLSSDGMSGLRAVDIAGEAIGIGMAADQYAGRVFSNHLNIGGFLSSQKKMSPEAQRRLISKLMEKFAGPANFHRPMILQDGIKFERAAMKADEAQLLEARKWQISEIARFFRIPLHMLGVDDQTNRSTVEEQSINLVKYTIRPWARRIEQAVRRDLIIATKNYEVKFNLDALERGNLDARKSYWAAALGEGGNRPGWMSVNEVRIAEGLNPIDEAWAWLVPQGKYDTPAPAAVDAAAPAAIAASGAPKIEDQTPTARAERLARKENKAFSKALVRNAGDPDTMRDWIKAFYGGHVSCVMEILDLRKNEAKAYCDFQKKEALESNDWPTLLERREEMLAGTVAGVLKRFGDGNGQDAAL
jgi:HK97 family phage portal protein